MGDVIMGDVIMSDVTNDGSTSDNGASAVGVYASILARFVDNVVSIVEDIEIAFEEAVASGNTEKAKELAVILYGANAKSLALWAESYGLRKPVDVAKYSKDEVDAVYAEAVMELVEDD